MSVPPAPPAIITPGTAMGEMVVRVGGRTTALDVRIDGRLVRRIRRPPSPGRIAVPLPVSRHLVQVRAVGPGGARWSRPSMLWVLPRSAQRTSGIGGRVDRSLQRDIRLLTGRVPAISGVYVQHLGTRCGAAVNAGARFPAASTLKTAILLDAERHSGGRPSGTVSGLLDRMIVDSSDRAANRLLEIAGGGSGEAGARRVTDTLRAMGLTESLVRRPYIIEPDAVHAIPVRSESQPALFTNFISTPYELARIMVAIHRGMRGAGPLPRIGVGPRTLRTEVVPRLLRVRDRTKLVAGAPDGVLVAHKSGYTEEVKHDAGIMYLPSGPVVVVAMTWSAGGVGDAVGDRFVADVARVAAARLRRGGRC